MDKRKTMNSAAKYMAAKNYNKAIILYKAIQKNDTKEDYYISYCLGVAYHAINDLSSAIINYCKAIELNTKCGHALENLAEIQIILNYYSDAIISLQSAIEINPKKKENYYRLSQIFSLTHDYESAVAALENCIRSTDANVNTYIAIGASLRKINKISESIHYLKEAETKGVTNAKLLHDLAFDYLITGNFVDGLKYHEFRLNTDIYTSSNSYAVAPRLENIDQVNGKIIFVCPEQGLGDQIQFSRYALKLLELGATVILAVDPPLLKIMQSLNKNIIVVTSMQRIEQIPMHDYYIPVMSLPFFFKTTLENIPAYPKYLDYQIEEIQGKLIYNSSCDIPRIGIVWSGSSIHSNDKNRSIPLHLLEDLFSIFQAEWHSLHIEYRDGDRELMNKFNIIDHASQISDFNDTAAIISYLDLIVTVDTSVAHLSASMGKPTWILLPFAPDFRWLLDRKDSPWYPSVSLFRQHEPGNWSQAISNVVNSLSATFKTL